MSQAMIYEMITSRIVTHLEMGVVPWVRQWGKLAVPKNFVTNRPYRGVNFFMLSMAGDEYFLTLEQAKDLGGRIKKCASGIPVVSRSFVETENQETGKTEGVPVLSYSTVYAASDTEGITVPEKNVQRDFVPVEKAERIVSMMPKVPVIEHAGYSIYYDVGKDVIWMPQPECYEWDDDFYCDLFMEVTHSTGAAHRLERTGFAEYFCSRTRQFSNEELISEMGSAFLCAITGVVPDMTERSAMYFEGWLKKLQSEPAMVIETAYQAQEAVDYILNISEQAETTESE